MESTDCIQHMDASIHVLETAIARKRSVAIESSNRKVLDADICLASRSAYFDFYAWVVLHGEIDAAAKERLDALFRQSISVMDPNEFRDSVKQRYLEFQSKCNDVHSSVYMTSNDLAGSVA